MQLQGPRRAAAVAAEMDAALCALPVRNTPNERAVRRRYSRQLQGTAASFVLAVARELLLVHGHRWIAYELIAAHKAAFRSIGETDLEQLGRGINSWWTVDAFARTLAGPAWLRGQVPAELIHKWARSEDRWWRRAALVSTVAWNVRSKGGPGDVSHTLSICRLLVADHDDMVAKAMSWALRALAVPEADAVREFLREHEDVLAARVRREVWSKLTTGRKNPRPRARRIHAHTPAP